MLRFGAKPGVAGPILQNRSETAFPTCSDQSKARSPLQPFFHAPVPALAVPHRKDVSSTPPWSTDRAFLSGPFPSSLHLLPEIFCKETTLRLPDTQPQRLFLQAAGSALLLIPAQLHQPFAANPQGGFSVLSLPRTYDWNP